MVARRSDALAATITEAGGGTAIVADLRNPDDCRRIADEALASIGAPELVLVAAGASTLGWVHETSAADWAVAFETNVIGVNLVFAALCPHLAPGAILAGASELGGPPPRRAGHLRREQGRARGDASGLAPRTPAAAVQLHRGRRHRADRLRQLVGSRDAGRGDRRMGSARAGAVGSDAHRRCRRRPHRHVRHRARRTPASAWSTSPCAPPPA